MPFLFYKIGVSALLKLLEEAIKGYSILEDTTYKIKLGTIKNNKVIQNSEVELELKFQSENFFHLFGFQYLENLDPDVNKKLMFKSFRSLIYRGRSIEDNRYHRQITTSPAFSTPTIQNRLNIIKDLPYLLDRFSKKNTYWHYEEFKGVTTEIDWDYLIILNSDAPLLDNTELYLFLRKATEANHFIPISAFSQETKPAHKYLDYKKDQHRYDVLKVVKVCL